jgi:ribonuclease R
MTISKEKILEAIQSSREPQVKIKSLSRVLGLGASDRRHLRESLDRMVREGILQKLRGGRFRIPPREPEPKSTPALPFAAEKKPQTPTRPKPLASNRVMGRLISHRDGYGFVEVEEQEPTAVHRFEGDIFIPPMQMRGALHGDRVVAEIDAIKRAGRAEGHVVKVLERKHSSVVGQFKKLRSTAVVSPLDPRFLHQVLIEAGDEGGAADGDVVDVEITRFPTPLESPRGRVTEILGKPGDFGIDVEIVIRKHHLPHRFPEEVLEAARHIPQEVSAEEIVRREDFRSLPIVTIDGETAKDFDDAVHVGRLSNGNFELQVHIADVSHYILPFSPLDEEAILRGTSVYFPDRAVPMLPEELSNGICSLKPKVDRLVQSCIMEISPLGEVVGHRFAQGVIRSVERMTYTDVARILVDNDPATMERYAPLVDHFRKMQELAAILNRMRDQRGSIDFDLPEPVITFDDNGIMTGVTRSERNIAHRLIEEFMLVANETVARELFRRQIPSLYRVHEPPNPAKVAEFETIARSFGHTLGIEFVVKKMVFEKSSRERKGRGRGQRPEVRSQGATGFANSNTWAQPTDIPITPRHYQHLVEQLEGKPEERILSYLMLRSFKQARYSEQNLGHFGLASSCYTHFTSPIRRYPDLMVHRILKSAVRQPATHATLGKGAVLRMPRRDLHYSSEQLSVIGSESSESERRANDAERELIEWKKAKFMQQLIGEEYDALIISVTQNGFYVELMELFIEGFVPVATLIDDYYVYRENMQSFVGERNKKKFRIGDRLKVIVDRVDAESHKIQFLVADIIAGASQRQKPKSKPRRHHDTTRRR